MWIVLGGCGGAGGGDAPDAASPDGPGAACTRTAGWATAPAVLAGPTQETATVAVDGKVYVIGGFNATAGVVRTVQIYDTATCSWSLGPELPRAVHHANAADVGGTIYVLGAMTTLDFRAIGDVWAWNPATDAGWTTRASMPAGTERGSAIVGVLGDRVILAGGLRGGAVAEVSAFDPATDTWDTALPPLPQPRDHACGGVIGGTLYVAGGRLGTVGTIAGDVFAYTPGGGWVARAAMPTPRGGAACGVIADRLIVVGGEGNPAAPSGVFPDVEAFAPATDAWEALAPMPVPRHGMGAAAWEGRLYVPGGASRQAFGAVDVHEVFTP